MNLKRLFTIYDKTDRPDLKYRTFVPRELRLTGKSKDVFEELRSHDILLHHPYDSYDAVVVYRSGRGGSECFIDQADVVPHQRALADCSGVDCRRGAKK